MDKINEIVLLINKYLWDILMYLLIISGLYFSVRLKFPQLTKFFEGFKIAFGGIFSKEEKKEGSMSSFQSLATAIAAQVGTGNIAGVASAILTGGPGAIFWMWVSAFFGMGTIFSEAVLAQHFRVRKDGEFVGGPAYYIKESFKGITGKSLAAFFSIAIIIALGFVGNMVQSNSITSAVTEVLDINPIFIGVFIAIMSALVFFGGMKRIANFAELVVPIMAFVYIAGSIVILFRYSSNIIPTINLIVKSAFSGNAAMGGIIGVTIKQAIQKGVARGLFSNEAGMGSTPHAHAVADVKHPVEQGLTALVGVFIDTAIVCTSTAMIILVTNAPVADPTLKGAQVTQKAFSIAFGNGGEIFLAICLTFFAFTTIIGWYYFGESNVKYLFGEKGVLSYRILVVIFIVLGSVGKVDLVWDLADLFNGFMVIPNILGLLALSGLTLKILKDYENCKKSGEIRYNYLNK